MSLFLSKRIWKLLKLGGSDWIVGDDLRALSRWMIKWETKQKKKTKEARLFARESVVWTES